ncbi:hypothetical protein Dimus_023938, partial [Dionaea muscipula]
MFAKFGVVKDVFIPRKRSMTGKRFGFVRYDCFMVAEAAIQKTNGIWIFDKELKVKVFEFHRTKVSRRQDKEDLLGPQVVRGTSNPVQRREPIQRLARWIPKSNVRVSSVYVVKPGRGASSMVPDGQRNPCTVERNSSNHHEYVPRTRSSFAQAMKTGGQSQEFAYVVKGFPAGNGWLYRSVVATFDDHQNSDTLLRSFIMQERGDVSVRRLGCKRILITFPSEERMTSFTTTTRVKGRIGLSLWKFGPSTRIAVLKGKYGCAAMGFLFTLGMLLVVGWKSFVIRVAEEQSVFICNSDFNRGYLCHKGDDEQSAPGSLRRENDDVEHGTQDNNTEVEGDNPQLLLAGSRDNIDDIYGRDRGSKSLEEIEMRGFTLETELGTQGSQEGVSGAAVVSGIGGDELVTFDGPQEDNGSVGGGVIAFVGPQVDRAGLKRPFSSLSGPVMNMEGINLEVVLGPASRPLIADLDNMGTFSEDQLKLERGQSVSHDQERLVEHRNGRNALDGGSTVQRYHTSEVGIRILHGNDGHDQSLCVLCAAVTMGIWVGFRVWDAECGFLGRIATSKRGGPHLASERCGGCRVEVFSDSLVLLCLYQFRIEHFAGSGGGFHGTEWCASWPV